MNAKLLDMLSAGNAELVWIWGKEGEMAMQSIHFAYSFGGVISPLTTEPFLTPNPEDNMNSTTVSLSNTSTTQTANWTEKSTSTNNSTAELPLTTNVHYAFIISGGLSLLVCIPLTVQLFSDRSQKRRQNEKDEKTVKQPLPKALFLFVLLSLCLMYVLYSAVEDTFEGYLTTFVVKQLHWSKSEGAQVSSVFWAAIALGRFLCIFAVHLLNPVRLLLVSCLALLLSMIAFLIMAHYAVYLGIWVFTAVNGIAMAAIFPTAFTWMEQELLRVTGRVASCILIGSSTGTMTNPIMLGFLMQQLTPMWFCYLLLGESALCLSMFLFLLALSRLYIRKHYAVHEAKILEIAVPSLDAAENAGGSAM